VWFKPTDKRVPLIAIPTEQALGAIVKVSYGIETSNLRRSQFPLYMAGVIKFLPVWKHPSGNRFASILDSRTCLGITLENGLKSEWFAFHKIPADMVIKKNELKREDLPILRQLPV
jgi:hypothetical protein